MSKEEAHQVNVMKMATESGQGGKWKNLCRRAKNHSNVIRIRILY